MDEFKQGTRVRFTATQLATYRHGDDGKLARARYIVSAGDQGMWVTALPDAEDGAEMHMIGVMCDGEIVMVPAARGWFEVVD